MPDRRPPALASASSAAASSRLSGAHQKRSASPSRSSGCARYGPGTSPHSRGVGKHLAGVREPVRIEGAPHRSNDLEVALGEHLRHRARLVDADRRARR